MRVKSLDAGNLLSFAEAGLTTNRRPIELGEFNLFIGKNNSGKSNVLKILDFINMILHSCSAVGEQARRQYPLVIGREDISFADWFFYQNLATEISFAFELEIEKNDQPLAGMILEGEAKPDKDFPVLFQFRQKEGWPKSIKLEGRVASEQSKYVFRFTKVVIPNDHSAYPVLFDESDQRMMYLGQDDTFDREAYKVVAFAEEQFSNAYPGLAMSVIRFLAAGWEPIFENSTIKLSAVRRIAGSEANPSAPTYQADMGIVKTLDSLRDGRLAERDRFRAVKEFLRQLIYPDCDRSKIEVIFPLRERNREWTRELEIDLDGHILPLSHFGSGVEQLLAMATEIVRHGPGKTVLIEEPEVHFHPDLQRKFIKFLKETNADLRHQYLISTHSSVFINEFLNIDANIFYVGQEVDTNSGRKYSRVAELSDSNLPDLLHDLNVKGSDLLQANGIIWVEGPSDKIYIQKWIELYWQREKKEGPAWVEGRHYQIVCYGGSLLKYVQMDWELDFWREENSAEINAFVNLLETNRNSVILMDRDDMDSPLDTTRWKAEKKKEIEGICRAHGMMAWITHRKEIEDYLPARFQKKVGAAAYKKGKVKGASEIIDGLQPTDLDIHDLEEKIAELVRRIEQWNC